MSLLDDGRKAPAPTGVCWVKRLPDDLQEEVVKVEEAIDAGERINMAAVTRGLDRRGFKLGASTVKRHFRAECSCR